MHIQEAEWHVSGQITGDRSAFVGYITQAAVEVVLAMLQRKRE